MSERKKVFPLRLSEGLSQKIDWFVFHTKASSKHQYIIDAINEKMQRDKAQLEALKDDGLRNSQDVP